MIEYGHSSVILYGRLNVKPIHLKQINLNNPIMKTTHHSRLGLMSLGIVATSMLLAANAGASVFVDFDSATDLNLFTINGTPPDPAVAFSATAGVGGGGGLDTSGDTRVYGYNGASYDIASISSLTIQLDAQKGSTNGIHNRIGLLTDLGGGFGDPNFYVHYNEDDFNIIGASTSTSDTGIDDTVIPVGNWTRIVLEISGDSTSWTINADLFDLGADGTSTPTIVSSLSGTETGIASDTSVYAGFKVNGGASALDNFATTIPEPSIALLAGFALSALLVRRRSR